MFENWKRSRIEKKFEKNLLKFKKKRKTSEQKILNVGILTTEEIASQIDIQREIETALNIKDTKILSFRNFNEKDWVSSTHFSEKDINWRGKFREPNPRKFIKEPFDLLIGYFIEDNLYVKTAVLNSKATFKAGFSGVNEDLYELEILGNTENPEEFSSELKKYLKILRKLNFK